MVEKILWAFQASRYKADNWDLLKLTSLHFDYTCTQCQSWRNLQAMIHGHREFESDHKPGLKNFHLLIHWFWNPQARWKIRMGPILMNQRAWNQRYSKNFHILKNEIQIGYKHSFACEYKLTSASKLCSAVYSKAYLDRQVDEICPRSPTLNYRPILSLKNSLKWKVISSL